MSEHTPGPWEYVPSTEHHGAYVAGPFGGDLCDCYTMSNPSSLSVRNGGDSKPIPFCGDEMDANARLIAAAPDLLAALRDMVAWLKAPPISDHNIADYRVAAEDAIAKAEGRS